MNRRSFFSKAAAFVAGCALGVKAQREELTQGLLDEQLRVFESDTFVFDSTQYVGEWTFVDYDGSVKHAVCSPS